MRRGLRLRVSSPLRRELVMLTVPILVETLLIMTLGAMDTFMLSRVSDESVAAVGLANQIISFAFIIFEVINLGTAVLCSQYMGARLQDRMQTLVGTALTVNLIFGMAVSALLFFCPRMILSAMGLEGHALALGAGYMEIVGSMAFVQALGMTLSAVLRSNNKAYYPMMVVLVVNVLNIIGNYMLIFGKWGAPELGVDGAAWSTVTARVVAMSILLIITFRTTIDRFPWRIFRRFPMTELKNLLKIGLPSAGEQMSYYCSQLVIAYFITMLGLEALAARTYCVTIITYVYLFCLAISHGAAISIGHLVGSGKWQGAYVMGKYVARIATLSTLAISLTVALNSRGIMSALTSNPEIIAMGVSILWIDVVTEIGRPLNILLVNTLQASGDVNYPFWVGVIFQWGIAVGMAWLLGSWLGYGILGMWWMFALDENVRGVVFMRRWNSRKWQHKGFSH